MLIVDRCSPGRNIPVELGVGLARKIGADIALQLIRHQAIHSNKISLTDADAILPSDYFDSQLIETDAALVFPFRHSIGSEQQDDNRAALLYEISLLYYACALDWAGSIHGYTSLGSAMAVNANHYAMVRGFPKRSAAEDFYLLNKLAKTGHIKKVIQQPIMLSDRLSQRVPFGTGPGIQKILDQQSTQQPYLYYHPGIFVLLREFLIQLDKLWENNDAMASASVALQQYYEDSRFSNFAQDQIKKQSRKAVFEKQLSDWFDGFRTLKFVHTMRDNYFPSVPVDQLANAEFIDWHAAEDLESLRQSLYRQLFEAAVIQK